MIANQEAVMSPDQIHHCLLDIGWTPEMLTRKLECHVSLVEAWLSGEAEIPPKAAAWITALAACHRAAEEGRPTSLKGRKYEA